MQALSEGLAKKQPADALLAEAANQLASALDARRVLLLTQTSDRKELEVWKAAL